MERVDKKTIESLMHRDQFLVAFLDFTQFKQLKDGYLANYTLSLYEEVYDIDDCFQDNAYVVLFRKSDSIISGFERVNLVEHPSSIYEKCDNDFVEYKSVITHREFDPAFYYIRE